jgi:arginyl-tRNA synthetase
LNVSVTAFIMSSLTLSGLVDLVAAVSLDAGLQLKTPIPPAQAADILTKPGDIYRSYLADILSDIIDCDAETIYEVIGSANDPAQGDLTVAVPRLKLKDVDPRELAFTVVKNVR